MKINGIYCRFRSLQIYKENREFNYSEYALLLSQEWVLFHSGLNGAIRYIKEQDPAL